MSGVLVDRVEAFLTRALVSNIGDDSDDRQFAAFMQKITADRVPAVKIRFREMLADDVDLGLIWRVRGVKIASGKDARSKDVEVAGLAP